MRTAWIGFSAAVAFGVAGTLGANAGDARDRRDAAEALHPGSIVAGQPMHLARASHSATLLPNGLVLIAGGFGGSGTESHPFASTELFDPRTGGFTAGSPMHVGRSGHTATQLYNGTLLIAGGWTGSRADLRATTELYDPRTGQFAAGPSMLAPRAGHTATLLTDGRVLIAGGVDVEDEALASAEIYDPRTRRFTATGSMTIARSGPTATLLPNGTVLITGGSSADRNGKTVYRSAELYDPATGAFSRTGDMLVPRHKHAAALLPTGEVLVAGGSDDRDFHGEYTSAELYDPTRGSFRPAGAMHLERFKFNGTMAPVDDGLLVAGGAASAELFDPATRSFRVVPGTLGAARFFARVTALPDGRALITGGYSVSPGSGLPSTAQTFLYTR